MIITAVAALAAGILCGAYWLPSDMQAGVQPASVIVLCILMISVGISVGMNKKALQSIRRQNIRVLLLPAGIVLGSILGGCIAAPFAGHTLVQGSAIAAGMGWYSLSGIMLTELMGSDIGTTAFFANILREILTFCMIPFLMKHAGGFAAIAAAGATSEDTTLPVLIRYGGEELVLIAVINGVLCSALVPVLLGFFSRL